MPDSEQASSSTWLNDDYRTLALTLATLTVATAGSAMVWRKRPQESNVLLNQEPAHSLSLPTSIFESLLSGLRSANSSATHRRVDSELKAPRVMEPPQESQAPSRETKRSKERRRRAKDPVVKELMKIEKRSRSSRALEHRGLPSTSGPSSSGTVMISDGADDTPRARSSSYCTPQLSPPMSLNTDEHTALDSTPAEPSLPETESGGDDVTPPAVPFPSRVLGPGVSVVPSVSAPAFPTQNNKSQPRLSRSERKARAQANSSDNSFSESPSTSISTSTSSSSSSFPLDFLLPTSKSMPASYFSASEPWLSSPSPSQSKVTLLPSSSMDDSMDSNSTATQQSSAYQNPPPRFRSLSRLSRASTSETSISFPTLGGSLTPPPTQIASLRGALEASRVREEISAKDAQRYARECEMLRWRWNEDAGIWRQREAELQAQIQFLTHQLHLVATMPNAHPQTFAPQGAHTHASGHIFPPIHPLAQFAYPTQAQHAMQFPQMYFPSPSPSASASASSDGDPEGNDGFSDELAEAILKRPESLRGVRGRARERKKQDNGVDTVLKFASIADPLPIPVPGVMDGDDQLGEGQDFGSIEALQSDGHWIAGDIVETEMRE